jgi:hypothetical protein
MNLAEIKKRLSNGFRPFTIRTSDGREFPVPHREFIMITKRSVVLADQKGFVDILDPLHISSIRDSSSLPTKE